MKKLTKEISNNKKRMCGASIKLIILVLCSLSFYLCIHTVGMFKESEQHRSHKSEFKLSKILIYIIRNNAS